jgi:hypothetical protein
MFLDTEIKMKMDEDEDYNVNPIQSTDKHKKKSIINKGTKGNK